MNQAEYERMVKIYNYVYSTLPNTPEREKRLAEIGEEDSSKLWDFYCGICSGRIKEPERTNSEVNTMGEKKIASYEDFIKALRYGENNMLCKFSETILKDMLIMLNRCEQVLDVKIRRKHEILNGWRKNTKSVVKF